MPKRTDIRKVMVIGSGPHRHRTGRRVRLRRHPGVPCPERGGLRSSAGQLQPATIMTDTSIADKVYMEPLTAEYAARIIRVERPDALIPGIGGQTGLNLAMELEKMGVLKECGVEMLGTSSQSIRQAEDRELFKELCQQLGEPVLPSIIANSMEEGLKAAEEIGYPVVLRPAFTLGGTGGGFADNEEECREILKNALSLSPVHQVLVEKSIKGYKEIEYEVIRDANDTAITICNMENIDPVGIHTGDSIVVAPSQTLTNKEYHLLRDSALKLIRALKIEGGCNVQFALDPASFRYYLIEVNPRVSRSSAPGFQGQRLPHRPGLRQNRRGYAPGRDSTGQHPRQLRAVPGLCGHQNAPVPLRQVCRRFQRLSTQMKATGEVMAVGRTIEESLLKAVRSLETGVCHLHMAKFDTMGPQELLEYIQIGTDDRIFAIAELIYHGTDLGVICNATKIDIRIVDKIKNIIDCEHALKSNVGDLDVLWSAKRMGFSDKYIAKLWDTTELDICEKRKAAGIVPVYKMIDTCAAEFDSYVPYFYSTYEQENESIVSDHKKIVVLGSGPIRIGQGVEFDYSTVHAVQTIKASGYEAIIINNNPETVSTDYTCSDKLYFEPLTVEDVMNVIDLEQPIGVIASLGGQTAINLAEPLMKRGVKIIGTDFAAIEKAENRDAFERVMQELKIPQPTGEAVTNIEDGIRVANRIGYPVLVRPSYVLGGRAMQIVSKDQDLKTYLQTAVSINEEQPVLVDKYIVGKELEVDAICDGTDVFVPGIMELVERTGIHSGDSISVYPTFSISQKVKDTILDYTRKLGLGIGIVGLYNIQFIVDKNENVYVIEVNPRSSPDRSLPVQSHRLFPGRYCNQGHSGPQPQGAGLPGAVPERKAALLCEGPGVLLLQNRRSGRLPVPGNEVHRRGHRLRCELEPGPV